jgi:hypothetical protein
MIDQIGLFTPVREQAFSVGFCAAFGSPDHQQSTAASFACQT